MKLLVSISNWHANRDQYLARIVKEYSALKKDNWRVDVVIYSRFPKKMAGAKVVKGYYEGTDFTWCGRKEIISAVDDYDLFVHSSDDVLIRRKSILAFLEETRRLPERFIASFNICELYKKQWYALNHHKDWPTADRSYWIGGKRYYLPRNRHWSGSLFTSQQLRKALKSGKFASEPSDEWYTYGMRSQEWAETNIYIGCNMLPVIPIDNLLTFKAEHLDRQYAKTGNFITLDEVKERALALQFGTVL